MASDNTSKAVAKRNASTALMAPPPAPKRIKRPSIVLDEDTYTSAISHIIRRDFFPGLAETDAQREYLSALDSKDRKWIREAGKRLTDVMTPIPGRSSSARNTRFKSVAVNGASGGQTPSTWGADTPRTVTDAGDNQDEEDEEGLGRLNKPDLDMSLNAFQAKYTSEDQESFNQLLDTQNRKRFQKQAWLHDGNRYASKQRLAQQKVIEARRQASSNNDMAVAVRPSQDLDDRPAAPNTHKHTAFNSLMFEPDGVEPWARTRAQAAQDASLAPPKRVVHANTRMPAIHTDPPRPTSPTQSAIRDAVAGRPRLSESEGGFAGSETPRVNGYAFVDAQPPSPQSDDDDEEAPTDLLERFGAKTNTSSSSSPFTISESQRREKLHHKMVDKISAAKRSSSTSASSHQAAGGVGARTPSHGLGLFTSETPRFLSAPTPAMMREQRQMRQGGMTPAGKKLGALTPAAQRLLGNVQGGASAGLGSARSGGGGGGFGKSGTAWTPTARVVGGKKGG